MTTTIQDLPEGVAAAIERFITEKDKPLILAQYTHSNALESVLVATPTLLIYCGSMPNLTEQISHIALVPYSKIARISYSRQIVSVDLFATSNGNTEEITLRLTDKDEEDALKFISSVGWMASR